MKGRCGCSASVPSGVHRVTQGGDEAARALGRILSHPEYGDDDVLGGELQVDVVQLPHQRGELGAGAAGASDVDCEAQRIPVVHPRPPDQSLVQKLELRDPLDFPADMFDSRQRPREQLGPVHRGVSARGVERGGEQGAGAGRFGECHAAVDHVLVDQAALAEVEDRGLGQAAQLVHRGEDEVRAALQGARGQKRREPQVRAPGFVDDQRKLSLVSRPPTTRRRRQRRRSKLATRSSPRRRPGSCRARRRASAGSGSARRRARRPARARRRSAPARRG